MEQHFSGWDGVVYALYSYHGSGIYFKILLIRWWKLYDAIDFSAFPCHCFCCWWQLNTCRFPKSPPINMCSISLLTPVPRLWRPHDLHATAQPHSKFDLPPLPSDVTNWLVELRQKVPRTATVKSLSTSWIRAWVLLISPMHSSSRNVPLQEQLRFPFTGTFVSSISRETKCDAAFQKRASVLAITLPRMKFVAKFGIIGTDNRRST
jgi:hypothetical protein